MLPHKREKRHLKRCPLLRRIRRAGDDPGTVGTAGRERRIRSECRTRSQHSRRSPAVHQTERCIDRCVVRCSGVWWNSTCRSWCSQGSLRDCARGTAPSPGFSPARWCGKGCTASCGTPTLRGSSTCVAHWPGRVQLEGRTQWMERPHTASPALEDASSARPSRSSPLMMAGEKGSPRRAGHCNSRIERQDGATARSRIECRVSTETARSGSGSRM